LVEAMPRQDQYKPRDILVQPLVRPNAKNSRNTCSFDFSNRNEEKLVREFVIVAD
jgi:hypothetical protein